MKAKRPILLTILDGWGVAKDSSGNAITQANMTFVESLKKEYPWVEAHASGEWVGLPEGQMGNSEVGHIHLGAGRIKYESLSLINKAIKDKIFENNEELNSAMDFAINNNSALHIMGLFSDGGVHSHMNHMFEVLKLAKKKNLSEVYLHLFGDGRDTKPMIIQEYIDLLQKLIDQLNLGKIASIIGRFFAMDRDKRFERTAAAYKILTRHDGAHFDNVNNYIKSEYESHHDDESLTPAFNTETPNGFVKKGDAVIFTNFRPDRAIQMASIFTNKNYMGWQDDSFKSEKFLGDQIYFVSMMKYADSVKSNHIAFKSIEVKNGLGEWLSKKQYRQLRIAETEKIAHVTFFFDGGKDYFKNGLATQYEITLAGASADLISSPKVATYDLKPEMSAVEITDKLISEIKKNEFDVIILNYANCDMVGHTGKLDSAIRAVKILDEQLKRVYDEMQKVNGIMIITADHGNAEIMIDTDGGPNKKHTSQPVPIIITDKNIKLREKDAAIADVAPTILDLLNEEIPTEMTQQSLILK
ncbi:2,3-bisphosphoglycerate-independent phosphoglycerate mutase [Spiroplasma endosymbiont of Labia minor]|uniref:2,3-bisphosphoglycerate-independent phosphoglycerate mutase n=1 Tax=Spiroplasma endosymbiont of Labia minor TaxID=3066305 RepID=UPI0030CE58A3